MNRMLVRAFVAGASFRLGESAKPVMLKPCGVHEEFLCLRGKKRNGISCQLAGPGVFRSGWHAQVAWLRCRGRRIRGAQRRGYRLFPRASSHESVKILTVR